MDEESRTDVGGGGASAPVKVEGEPSPYLERLKNARAKAAAGGLPQGVEFEGVGDGGGGGYQLINEAVSEAGVFPVVGGYTDASGTLHNVVQMRSLSGEEEDLLASEDQPFSVLINSVLANCTVAIGSVVDPVEIRRAIFHDIPAATRLDMLIALRCVSHWETTASRLEVDVECPKKNCRRHDTLSIDLIQDLERYDPPEPTRDEYSFRLRRAEVDVVWRRMRPDMNTVLEVISSRGDEEMRQSMLTFAILARLQLVGREKVLLSPQDFISSNYRAVKLSKAARRWFQVVRKWSVADRGALRAHFIENEPGVNLEYDHECKGCGLVVRRSVDMAQRGFFFPQEALAISKRTSST